LPSVVRFQNALLSVDFTISNVKCIILRTRARLKTSYPNIKFFNLDTFRSKVWIFSPKKSGLTLIIILTHDLENKGKVTAECPSLTSTILMCNITP